MGGQEVYPTEVESVLLEMDNISEVSLIPNPNPIMGNIVAVRVNLESEESLTSLKKKNTEIL